MSLERTLIPQIPALESLNGVVNQPPSAFSKFWAQIPIAVQVFVPVMVLLGLVVTASKLTSSKTPKYNKSFIEGLSRVLKDVQDQQKLAQSLQPSNELGALVTVYKALGGLTSIKRFANEQDLANISGVNVSRLEKSLEDLRDTFSKAFEMPQEEVSTE
jgi:hypothetical protein